MKIASSRNIIIVAILLLFGIGVVGAFLSGAFQAEPEPPPKKIGIVQVFAVLDLIVDGLKAEMEELGYREGKDVLYEYRSWEQDPTKIDGMVQELLDKEVDVIVTVSVPSAVSALKLTADMEKPTPIVHTYVDVPDETGVAKSLRSSGNNATGIASNMAEVIPKQLEFLKKIDPDAKKIGIFSTGFINPQGPGVRVLSWLHEYAPQLGMEVVEYATNVPPGPGLKEEFQRIGDTIQPGDIDAMVHPPGHFLDDLPFLEVALGRRLQIINMMPVTEELKGTGGTFTYSAESFALGRQTAVMLDKIFQGTAPTDIPIEFPEKNVFVINLENARANGITIPRSVLELADDLIE